MGQVHHGAHVILFGALKFVVDVTICFELFNSQEGFLQDLREISAPAVYPLQYSCLQRWNYIAATVVFQFVFRKMANETSFLSRSVFASLPHMFLLWALSASFTRTEDLKFKSQYLPNEVVEVRTSVLLNLRFWPRHANKPSCFAWQPLGWCVTSRHLGGRVHNFILSFVGVCQNVSNF